MARGFIKGKSIGGSEFLDTNVINHNHQGTSGTTSPNGCYRQSYTSSENFAHGTGYDGRIHSNCPRCGDPNQYNTDKWGRHCSYCNSYWTLYTSHCYACGLDTSDDSGNHNHNITRYKLSCTHGGEDMGSVYLASKRRNLIAAKSKSSAFTISNYAWSGVASGNEPTATATDAGEVSVDVTILDPYGGQNFNTTLVGMVE